MHPEILFYRVVQGLIVVVLKSFRAAALDIVIAPIASFKVSQ